MSPRFVTYIALPGGAKLVTRAAGSPGLAARGTGFEVGTSSGLCPDWAAAAGSSNASLHETNPRARQDKTMIRIELERRKFFSVKTRVALSPDASGQPIPVLVTCGQGHGGRFLALPATYGTSCVRKLFPFT